MRKKGRFSFRFDCAPSHKNDLINVFRQAAGLRGNFSVFHFFISCDETKNNKLTKRCDTLKREGHSRD